MRGLGPLILCLTLTACDTAETTRLATPDISLPPMKTFSTAAPSAPVGSNAQIARDFLDLTFTLENGSRMQSFSRFEGPITVSVTGNAPPSLGRDLDELLTRLRREANIPIRRVGPGQRASVTIEPIPQARIQSAAPRAACFVRPNVSRWDEYRARRTDRSTYWTQLTKRTRMAIFVPSDGSPQMIRDCLHEEVSQALGPVNDLYRLTESVFNDDNFHTVLTGYDMLILRAFYDPALQTGMREPEVAARLPAILNRLNPRGRSGGIALPTPNLRNWKNEITKARALRSTSPRRLAAAWRAVAIAQNFGPSDPRLAFSYYILGRSSLTDAPETALSAFLKAGRIYENRRDSSVQSAHVAMQVAAIQLSIGRAEAAIRLVDQSLPTVKRTEHAALLSLLLMVKAEALLLLEKKVESARVQKEALAWARYGFGADDIVRERAAEILAISPRSRQGDPA